MCLQADIDIYTRNNINSSFYVYTDIWKALVYNEKLVRNVLMTIIFQISVKIHIEPSLMLKNTDYMNNDKDSTPKVKLPSYNCS